MGVGYGLKLGVYAKEPGSAIKPHCSVHEKGGVGPHHSCLLLGLTLGQGTWLWEGGVAGRLPLGRGTAHSQKPHDFRGRLEV